MGLVGLQPLPEKVLYVLSPLSTPRVVCLFDEYNARFLTTYRPKHKSPARLFDYASLRSGHQLGINQQPLIALPVYVLLVADQAIPARSLSTRFLR